MIRILLLFILFYSCNTEPVREEIEVNKTIKIEASNFPTSNNSYNYLWSKPEGPIEKSYIYKVEDNKMLFTPIRWKKSRSKCIDTNPKYPPLPC